jgi:hypothetical protein
MGKLDGKIALITGGNSGIGLATAKRFVEKCAYVFITRRRDAAVRELGSNVTAVRSDVSNLGDLDRLFARGAREKGRLDRSTSGLKAVRLCAPVVTWVDRTHVRSCVSGDDGPGGQPLSRLGRAATFIQRNMLVALVRRSDETLHQLLDRLERGFGPAIEDQVFIDEINPPD